MHVGEVVVGFVGNNIALSFKGEKVVLALDEVKDLLVQTNEEIVEFFQEELGVTVDAEDVKNEIQGVMKKAPIVIKVVPDYKRIKLKLGTYFESVRLVYQEKIMAKSGRTRTLFNVHELGVTGFENPPMYLLTPPTVRLRNVNQFLQVAPFTEPSELEMKVIEFKNDRILDRIKEKYGFAMIDKKTKWKELSNEEKWSFLLDRHFKGIGKGAPIFLKLISSLTKDEESEVKDWDFSELEHNFLYEGLKDDPDIVYIYRGQLVHFEDNPLRVPDTCKNIQPYNSNAIVSSLTKRGKTSTGEKVMGGEVYDEVSKARIKGYATADKVFVGDAHMQYRCLVFDNTQNAEPGFFGHCLELAEKGATKIGKGAQSLVTRCTASIVLHANPPHVKDPKVLVESFVDFIKRMSISTAGPVGSRFAYVGFFPTDETAMVTGTPLDGEIVKKNKIVFFDHILKTVNEEVRTKIFPNKKVQEWRNKELKDYARQIKKFIVPLKPTLEQVILEFWIDHGEGAFRHIRGAALKQACMDNLEEIYNKNYSTTKILQDAEIHVKKICDLNIKCLHYMLETIGKMPREEWVLSKYNAIKNKKAKAVVLTVAVYAKKTPQACTQGHMIPLEMIADDYNELPKEKKIEGYSYLSNVIHNLPHSLDKFNNRLGDLGFTIVRTTDQSIPTVCFVKDNAEGDSELQILAELLLEKQ